MTTPTLYPQDKLDALLQALSGAAGVEAIDAALVEAPGDPRLHFLRGSVLAGDRRYDEARIAITRAVDMAPDFAIARFQLGFLEFTSGEAGRAGQTWAPLQALPQDDALRLFATGLMRLPADDIEGAVAALRLGIAANTQNPPLNRDMQMLIDELLSDAPPPGGDKAAAPEAQDEPATATQMLLRQFGTRH